MLVLSRKPGEKVVITGGITISVLEVVGCRVKLGIEAPDQVCVLRTELARWLEPDEAPRAPAPQQDSP
jgi:carbon storage regulator